MEVKDAANLKKYVKRRGISVRKLAELCDLKSHTYLARLLRGEAKTLNPTAVTRLCLILNVPIDDFFVTKASGDPGRGNRKAAA